MKHNYYIEKDIRKKDRLMYKMVVDDGLNICKVCNLYEGSLTTDCPGEIVYEEYNDKIYTGKIDFRNGKWVNKCSPHSPAHSNKR